MGLDGLACGAVGIEHRLPARRHELRIRAGTVRAEPLVQELELLGRQVVETGSFELGLRHAFLERRGLLRRLGGGSDRGGEGEHNGKNTWKSAHVFYRRESDRDRDRKNPCLL